MKQIAKHSKSEAINILTSLLIFCVLFLHRGFYTMKFISVSNFGFNALAYFAVGGFIFLSGYKLTKSKLQNSFTAFWKNRFTRIYPLYLLAIISYVLIIYSTASWQEIVKHLLLIQIFIPHLLGQNFLTLYFVGLIFAYYLFFSLTKSLLKKPLLFLLAYGIAMTSIVGAAFLTRNSWQLIEPRLILYLTMFAGSMLFAYYEEFLPKAKPFIIALSFIIPILCLLLLKHHSLLEPAHFFAKPGFITLIIAPIFISFYYGFINLPFKKNRLTQAAAYISQASFAMFLFHRPIWELMKKIYPTYCFTQWLFILGLGIPLIIIVSAQIQNSYTKLLGKLQQ
ncbi:acyltransferase [Candidatus Beckwithbacteria bacterium]|nr:acyltransferase [Candidatus Beckwithbacteria bacterium]